MWQTSNGRIDRIVVFADREGRPVPMGELKFEGAGRTRLSTFRYARSWLSGNGHGIDPTYLCGRGGAFRSDICEVPLPFLDATPDGWGRAVLAGAFPDQHFGEGEYLAASGDERVGELRFGSSENKPPERWTPPSEPMMTVPGEGDTIEELQAAAEAVDAGQASKRHFDLLFRASGDMGGARPKAAVLRNGVSWIAKFRAQGDTFDDPRIEATCLTLARACGIEVSEHEVEEVRGRSVLFVRRFDRGAGGERIGYSSAATMMGVKNSDYGTEETYASLATKARQQGVVPCEAELFCRMLFNCFVHNTDDHLRNHGFIREGAKWRLSPAFDLTLQRRERLVMRPVAGISPLPDPVEAFAAHPAFGLDRASAVAIYERVAEGMSEVYRALDKHGVSRSDRGVVAARWKNVFSPRASSELPVSPLVRPAAVLGADPEGRLSELGVGMNPETHEAKRVGRSISVYRKGTRTLDNVPGMPARVRDAWTTTPTMEFFRDGEPSAPLTPGLKATDAPSKADSTMSQSTSSGSATGRRPTS